MSPNDSSHIGADALKISAEFVETAANAMIDGTELGTVARGFLLENKDRLVGLSTSAFRVLVDSLRGAKSVDDLHAAKLAYVQALPYADLLEYQATSAEALVAHGNAQVRASSFFDAVADVGTRILPKLVPVLLKFVV